MTWSRDTAKTSYTTGPGSHSLWEIWYCPTYDVGIRILMVSITFVTSPRWSRASRRGDYDNYKLQALAQVCAHNIDMVATVVAITQLFYTAYRTIITAGTPALLEFLIHFTVTRYDSGPCRNITNDKIIMIIVLKMPMTDNYTAQPPAASHSFQHPH